MFKSLPTTFVLAANLILAELAFAGDITPVSYLSINNHKITQTGTNDPEVEKILISQKGLLIWDGYDFMQSRDLRSFSFEIDSAQLMRSIPDPSHPQDVYNAELMIFDFNGAADNNDMPIYLYKDIAAFGIEVTKQGEGVRVRLTSATIMDAEGLNKIQKAGGFAYLRASP